MMKIGRLWNDMLALRRNKVLNDKLIQAIMLKYMERCFAHIDAKTKKPTLNECEVCKYRPNEINLF